MKDIEERLKARAGNFPLKDSYIPKKIGQTEKKEAPTYGTGISEEEIQKIIKEFKNL
jgi:hypothetical protein